ncbi:MAG TPA: DUF4345 domain-containing protein [Pseudonocardia sp.]|jgi:hypothetical protein|nr:DUF4345 domain-containing protein [Pseudonocardia sp.]
MATVLIALVAVFFLGMGLFGLFAPAALIRPFGISLTGPEARTEVRAVYGGFGVATGVLLAFAAAGAPSLRPGAILAVAAALGGMAFGRLVARAVDRPTGFYPSWLYFWVEAVAAGLLVASAG